jgi:hypothetical protein
VSFLQRHRSDGRIVGVENALANDYQMVYSLSDVRADDPPYPDRHYLALWRVAEPDQPDSAGLYLGGVSPAARNVLSVLGVRYILAPATFANPGLPNLPLAYQGADGSIYENREVTPRVMVPAEVSEVPSEAAFLAQVASPGFQPAGRAVVEVGTGHPELRAAHGTAELTSAADSSVDIRTHLSRPGLVVLNDTLAPGWSVSVDGRPTRPLRVNGVMRGVSVPSGTHTVHWSYEPPGLRLGLILTALGLAITLGAGMLIWRSRGSREADVAPARC